MNRLFWKPFRIAVVLATASALLATFSPVTHRLESLLPAWTSRFLPDTDTTHNVAVVAIDAASLDVYGDWPWSHDRLAAVVNRLAQSRPKAIGLMLPLATTETPGRLGDLRAQLETLDAPLRSQAASWLQQLDTDAQLADALQNAGTVVLAASDHKADSRNTPARFPQQLALGVDSPQRPWYSTAWRLLGSGRTWPDHDLTMPARPFTDSASGIGLLTAFDDGQHVQGSPLVVRAHGHYLPAFELALYAASKQLNVHDFSVDALTASLDTGNPLFDAPGFGYYPRSIAAPPVYSLHDIMTSDALARGLRHKTVILGLSAPGLAPVLDGPAGRSFTPLSWSAQVLDSMLSNNAFAMQDWFFAAQRGLLLLLGGYLLLLPARWRSLRGVVAAAVIAAALLNAGVLALLLNGLWLPVALPALFLLSTQTLLSIAHRSHSRLEAARQATVEARIALGGNLQTQGRLDGALQQFTRCLPAPEALEPLYELGLEFERRRQVNKALGVYEQIEHYSRDFRDCARRREQLKALSDRFPSASPASAAKTLVLDSPLIELPVLGRYRLERELGRGAMGTVYLGTDPTIGRQVAVKTLPIMEAYEGNEQAEIAARFFREAEAVGRLDHPNIVSVHDAGKEHDLAYIAMDYVPGESLDAWTGESGLLPVWEVLDIAAQVADALAYAHSRQVAHRDIKPGNILYDRDNGVAKLTDFGIARVLDASRTRSGTVLGTPFYMSPEQAAGKKVDGRSDLFSLGSTLYQLLTGSLPFQGDSVATLMYQITSQPPRPIRKLRRGLPLCVARLVSKALQKEPAKRFANGEAMAAAILGCRAHFKGGRRKSA